MASFPRPRSSPCHIPTSPTVMQTSWLSFVMWEYSAPWVSRFLWLTRCGNPLSHCFFYVSFPVSLSCGSALTHVQDFLLSSLYPLTWFHIFLSAFSFLRISFQIYSWFFFHHCFDCFLQQIFLVLLSFLFKSYISLICNFFQIFFFVGVAFLWTDLFFLISLIF